MSPEDKARLQREIDLWLARRGGDYSREERSKRLFIAELSKGQAALAEHQKRRSYAIQIGEIDQSL